MFVYICSLCRLVYNHCLFVYLVLFTSVLPLCLPQFYHFNYIPCNFGYFFVFLQFALNFRILESFEGVDKKDLTQEKIATTVAEGLMKIYDTNLCKFDCLAIKTCLLFFLFITLESEHSTKLVIMLEELFDRSLDNLVLYGNQMRAIASDSKSHVSKAMVRMLACLTSDFDHFEMSAEK